jgi:hypothetical protein
MKLFLRTPNGLTIFTPTLLTGVLPARGLLLLKVHLCTRDINVFRLVIASTVISVSIYFLAMKRIRL